MKSSDPTPVYRGRNNPANKHTPSSAGGFRTLRPRQELDQEDRPPLLPGRKSRRPRKNVWVPV